MPVTATSTTLRLRLHSVAARAERRYKREINMRALLASIFMMCMAASALTIADPYQPSHDCSKPDKPFEFEDEWELENFNSEVEDYKQCISDFVDEQNEAVRHHQNAAQDAIDEWNSFVNYEPN